MRTPLKTIARANIIRPLLAATLGLAITFTLGCGDHGFDDIFGESSSSGIAPSSSSRLSSSSQANVSSSSSSIASSSSSGTPPSSSSPLPLSSSQAQAIVPVHGDPITDSRDGKTYETVVIGTQTWTAKNLDYEAEGSKCYNDNTLNCTLYGRLYNWETAMNACPDGWHLPSDFEWVVLEDFIGSGAWKKLKTTSGWSSNGNGTDNYGFSALPGGGGSGSYGSIYYSNVNTEGYWWASTENGTNAYYRRTGDYGTSSKSGIYYSVRCLKGDKYIPPSTPSYNPVSCQNIPEKGGFCDDRDGRGYESVTIDGKTWMAENLAFNASGSVCYAEGNSGVSADSIAKNCTTYGRLYDWSTAMAFEPTCNKAADCKSWIAEKHKGICPAGWHIPSDAEWAELVTFAGGSSTAGQILKATSGWTSGNGADLLGFSALPGGGSIFGAGTYGGSWWSATEYNASYAYFRYMSDGYASVNRTYNPKTGLYSVRCVKD